MDMLLWLSVCLKGKPIGGFNQEEMNRTDCEQNRKKIENSKALWKCFSLAALSHALSKCYELYFTVTAVQNGGNR